MSDRVEKLVKELDDITEILAELKENTQGESVAAETYKVLHEIYNTRKQNLLKELGIIQEALKKSRDTAFVTFGRFNPMTKGHEEMIDFMADKAKAANADAIVFTSAKQDAKKNPLTWDMKVRFLKKFFPHVQISDVKNAASMFDALYVLRDMGYTKVHLFVGEDREVELMGQVENYLEHKDPEKRLGFKEFKLPSTPPRTEGVSGSQMRKYAVEGDMENFTANLPSKANDKDARFIFNAVRAGLEAKPKQKSKTKNK